MILNTLAHPQVAWRMHTPKWASTPTSGAGAALHGGRLNRPGTQALYLALDAATAIAEYQQLSPLMPPGTLVTYEVAVAPLVDFRAGFEATQWSALWEEFHCDWRALAFGQHIEPPTWVLADEVLAVHAKGVLFPSAIAPGGVNLVVYTQSLESSDVLRAYDPGQALPKDQSSWA